MNRILYFNGREPEDNIAKAWKEPDIPGKEKSPFNGDVNMISTAMNTSLDRVLECPSKLKPIIIHSF